MSDIKNIKFSFCDNDHFPILFPCKLEDCPLCEKIRELNDVVEDTEQLKSKFDDSTDEINRLNDIIPINLPKLKTLADANKFERLMQVFDRIDEPSIEIIEKFFD